MENRHSTAIREAMDLLRKDVKEEGHVWSVESSNETVEVKSTKRKKETSIPLYKAKGILPLTTKDLLNKVVLDAEAVKKWSSVIGVDVVETVGDMVFPGYQIYRQTHAPVLGGVISPRDFICCRSYTVDSNGDIWFVCISVEDDRVPQDKNYVRGHLYLVAWHATALESDPTKCIAQNIVHTNIKGWLPTKVVSRGVLEEMGVAFDKIKKLFPS